MRLTRIDDPRDNLERADRDQLFRFARAKGVTEINDRIYNGGNAANLMRLILRQKGVTDIDVPYHQLGLPPQVNIEDSQPSGQPAVMLDDMLRQQLKDVQAEPAPAAVEKPISGMSIRELRKECTARGIKMERTDNVAKLKAKLGG